MFFAGFICGAGCLWLAMFVALWNKQEPSITAYIHRTWREEPDENLRPWFVRFRRRFQRIRFDCMTCEKRVLATDKTWCRNRPRYLGHLENP